MEKPIRFEYVLDAKGADIEYMLSISKILYLQFECSSLASFLSGEQNLKYYFLQFVFSDVPYHVFSMINRYLYTRKDSR